MRQTRLPAGVCWTEEKEISLGSAFKVTFHSHWMLQLPNSQSESRAYSILLVKVLYRSSLPLDISYNIRCLIGTDIRLNFLEYNSRLAITYYQHAAIRPRR